MMNTNTTGAQQAIINRLCEFLNVATHAVLYIHKVYPERLFEQRQKWGIATFFSKHPTVNNYITNVITEIRTLLLQNMVESITIALFYVGSQKMIAKYVYEIVQIQTEIVDATRLGCLETQLRAHLCRLLSGLQHNHNVLIKEKTKDEVTFDFILRTTGVRTAQIWMPADGMERREMRNEKRIAIPLKDADHTSDTIRICSRIELNGKE